MKNLVIGNTSQLSHYFPKENFDYISSRNIDYNYINKEWDRVYMCFGESRKFINDIKIYDEINFNFTINLIDFLKNKSKNIIVYSTCELWNQYSGPIDINKNFNFYSTPYLSSKHKLTKYIFDNKEEYYNVFVMFPFNFNSIYRNQNFLFGKIFNSIIQKKPIEIGNTYFYRDIVHPKFVVQESINATRHKIIGSGRMIFVNDFIRDLYDFFNMNYEDYIFESFEKFNEYEKTNEYYLKSQISLLKYKDLLNLTIEDIKTKI
jgi:nucleoside-diphosphate-sugar epimerase